MESLDKVDVLLEMAGLTDGRGHLRPDNHFDMDTLIRLASRVELMDEDSEWQRELESKVGPVTDPLMREVMTDYYEGEHKFQMDFEKWSPEYLEPQVRILQEIAGAGLQWDSSELYQLERQKLICMRLYFSHCRFAKEGRERRTRWIDTCIRLLDYILEDDKVTPEKIHGMNIRNVGDIVDAATMEDYRTAPEHTGDAELDKTYYGRKIYLRKMERLYYRIRLNKMQEWWE